MRASPATDEPYWTNERLKDYSQMQMRLNPKGDDLYKKVRDLFGPVGPWTDEQVIAAQNPKHKVAKPTHPEKINQHGPMPLDGITRSRARSQLDAYERALRKPDEKGQTAIKPDKLLSYTGPDPGDPTKTISVKVNSFADALDYKYGKQDWYTYSQVREVESDGVTPLMKDREWPPGTPIFDTLGAASMRQKEWWEDFRSPRIRQSWRDVLYEEDMSQDANQGKAVKDLVGATFSYAYNGKADSDTWTAIGAVILPWEHSLDGGGGWVPTQMALAPSVSINRVDTNGDPKVETDSLLYRFGLYFDWRLPTPRPAGLQVRAAGVYATDTGGSASLPGYETDLEPHWQNSYFPLGYRKIIISKATVKDDNSDWSALDYTLRAWLHIEGGDVQDNGKSWDSTKGSFSRLGPTVQFQLNAPRLIFGKDASLTALYSYLPSISGSDVHDSYFKVTAVYNLFKDDTLNHKVSLNIGYEKGGLNFTKEDVDVLTIGLGVLF